MNGRQISLLGAAKSPSKSKIPRSVIKTVSDIKRHVGVQCDFFGIILENLKPDNCLDDEIKRFYSQCLGFINNYHGFLNKQLEVKFGRQEEVLFKLQEVQNYVMLVEFLKNSAKNKNVTDVKLEESKGQENQNCACKYVDSGFDSKESSEDIHQQLESETNLNKSGVKNATFADSLTIEDQKKNSDEPIEGQDLKKEVFTPLENKVMIVKMIKHNISNYLTKNSKEQQTKIDFSQGDVPEELQKPDSLESKPVQPPEKNEKVLLSDDNSSILDDEEFDELVSSSNLNMKNDPKTDNKQDLKENQARFEAFKKRVEIKQALLKLFNNENGENTNILRQIREKCNSDLTRRRHSLLVAPVLESSDSSDIHSDSEIELSKN